MESVSLEGKPWGQRFQAVRAITTSTYKQNVATFDVQYTVHPSSKHDHKPVQSENVMRQSIDRGGHALYFQCIWRNRKHRNLAFRKAKQVSDLSLGYAGERLTYNPCTEVRSMSTQRDRNMVALFPR